MKPVITLTAFFGLLCGQALIAADNPNILFIFSDDHAQHAISAYGSKVNQTPHLDRLAKDGARFTNSFVTNSICTPSRATLLTGQYSHLNGVPVFNRFDGDRDNVAKHLQAGGYHTGMVGKWRLGSDPTGFDRWIVLPGQGAYWNPQFLLPGKKRLTIEGHCTDITTDLGIEWLKTRPQPGHVIDLMATCVDLARANYPAEHNGEPILPMSRSLLPAFKNEPLSRDALFWEHEGHAAIRVGD